MKPRPDSYNLRQKEDGFSIYLMGANEDRIKNLRKKELVDKGQKNRPKNNSRSIANRRKWDLSDIKNNNAYLINNNIESNNNNNSNSNNKNNINNDINIVNASRSKSKKKQETKKPIGAHIDYKAISKLILNNTNSISNINFNLKNNYNYENNQNQANSINYLNNNSTTKNINSKDSITNLEEMLNDIHTVNKNITNLNKFNLNPESPINKRRRNWGEPKYNIVFPDLSSNIEQGISTGGVISSKNKKRNLTNYSNNIISDNNLNSSFNKITENEIDGYNSVLGGEYSNLNSSIAGISKERDIYLGKNKLSSASNNNESNSRVNFITNNNQNYVNLTYEKNSVNNNNFNYYNKNQHLNSNSNNLDYSNNSSNSMNNNNIHSNNNNKENVNSKKNIKNCGSSLILSNLNHSSNHALSYNKNTYSSNSNNNINSNPDINIIATKSNNKNSNSKGLSNLNNLSSNKQLTNIFESTNSGVMTNRFWEAGGNNTNRKNINLNSSNELGKNDEVMLVLENLNNSDILNISNSGINNMYNQTNYMRQQNLIGNSSVNYMNAKVNSETGVKTNNKNNSKKYNNIGVNLNGSNTSNLNTRKFISLNSQKEIKLEELNNSTNKNKINMYTKNVNLNLNNMNNSNIINNNGVNMSTNNNTVERPFSSIVNLSKLKSEKLKISDLGSVSGISPKNNIPSIQFIYKSPQNINFKGSQRPLSHIQKSKSTINSKTSTNYIQNNLFHNNNNINFYAYPNQQNLGNPFECSTNAHNFKSTNTYNTMERFSSREKQTNIFNNNNNNNLNSKLNNNFNAKGNLLNDEPNTVITKDISNTQFNFSRKKNQYPTISNVQKISGNNVRNNINNLNNVLNNLIYSRNPSTNSKNKNNMSNTSNIIESNVVLSSSNYNDINMNYNNKKKPNANKNSSNSNSDIISSNYKGTSKNNSANKNNITEKKNDLMEQLEKLDEKKIKKVFKYIEKLSDNTNFDTSGITVLESRTFLENKGNSIDKLNINYIKTDSINFGNININVNNNNNSNNSNNVNNNFNSTSSGISQVNYSINNQGGTPHIKKDVKYNNPSIVKNKTININNSLNAGNNNNMNNITKLQKPCFSSSMKERKDNMKYQTLEDEGFYATYDKDEINCNSNTNDAKKTGIKSILKD